MARTFVGTVCSLGISTTYVNVAATNSNSMGMAYEHVHVLANIFLRMRFDNFLDGGPGIKLLTGCHFVPERSVYTCGEQAALRMMFCFEVQTSALSPERAYAIGGANQSTFYVVNPIDKVH